MLKFLLATAWLPVAGLMIVLTSVTPSQSLQTQLLSDTSRSKPAIALQNYFTDINVSDDGVHPTVSSKAPV